jgi:hypothetical protein
MDWTTSNSRPGYQEKTLRHGSATITVYRPNLNTSEREAREREVAAALKPILANYIRRVEDRKEITL